MSDVPSRFAQRVRKRLRLVDIPLPRNGHGLYEELHDFASGEALSNALQRRSVTYFGIAGGEFVFKLADERRRNAKSLKGFINNRRQRYLQAIANASRGKRITPLNRASDRFATTFAAGCLAAKYGIVPWSRRKLLKAILSCQLDQLLYGEEDEDTFSPAKEMRVKLVDYLDKNKGQFMNLNKKRPVYRRDELDAVPGYRVKQKGQRWLYLPAKQLDVVIGKGRSAHEFKEALVTEGLLAQGKGGKFVVQRLVYKGGKRNQNYAWVYAIKADILASK